MNFIEIKNLCVNYESAPCLHEVSLKVEQGELLVLIGPNGSGKSSLLKAMAGLIEFNADVYILSGQVQEEMSRLKRSSHLSYMPQSPEIDPSLTVEDYFHYSRFPQMSSFRPLNIEEIEFRNEILRKLNLFDFLSRRISEVSGGELKKLMIGGSFFQGGEFVLLDEPFQALDPVVKVEVSEFITFAVKKYQVGIVMACHDLYWARKLAGNMLFLKNGESLIQGAAEHIFSKEKLEELYGQEFSLFVEEGSRNFVFLPRQRQ